MTALAGLWRFDGSDAAEGCARMLDAQALYAQAPPSQWSEGGVALGRALWHMLPEDRHDRQPLTGGGGRLVLVADARLDNRAELCRDLGIPADAPVADADVILGAAEAWGEDFLPRLIGDFALALWDRERERLLLARDFLGQRPLHYHRGAGFFAFASMPKGLHALPGVERAPNPALAAEFLAQMPRSGPETFFAGICRVEPGQVCLVDRHGLRSHSYWRPDLTPLRLGSSEDYAEALREKLDRAVARRLRGVAGAFGSHLSGGLDSSAVCTSAARQAGDRRLFAFTSVAADVGDEAGRRGYFADEGRLAGETAAAYPNIEHVVVRAQDRSPLSSLDRNFRLYEQPVINLTNTGWWDRINDEARARGLTVMLTGQAGNFSFSYTGLDLLPVLLGEGRWLELAGVAAGLRRRGWPARRIAGTAFGPFVPRAAWALGMRLLGRRRQDVIEASCVDPALHAELARRARARGFDPERGPRRGSVEGRLANLRSYDPGSHNKGMLAGWGLDVRDATGDRELVEYCLRVPAEQFILGGVPRSLARRALEGRVPDAVVAELRTGLQDAGWHRGFAAARADIEAEVQRILSCPPAREMLDTGRIAALLEGWPEGGWDDPELVGRYRDGLLMAISAGHFIRSASDAAG